MIAQHNGPWTRDFEWLVLEWTPVGASQQKYKVTFLPHPVQHDFIFPADWSEDSAIYVYKGGLYSRYCNATAQEAIATISTLLGIPAELSHATDPSDPEISSKWLYAVSGVIAAVVLCMTLL